MNTHWFGIRLSIGAIDGASFLLDEFLVRLRAATRVQVVSRTAQANEAEAVVCVPWADKELARIEWNIYIAEVENRCAGQPPILWDLESCKVLPPIPPQQSAQ